MNLNHILELMRKFEVNRFDYSILIIANVNNTVQDEESFVRHSDFSEFFSKAEFACISSAIIELFGYVRIFYSEIEFIQYILNNVEKISLENTIVFNFSRDGLQEGKKSLIPAFCDLIGLKYSSSNAFVISLLRNKYVYTQFLKSVGIPVPYTTCSNLLEENDKMYLKSKKYIIKNIFESASIGIEKKNIINVSNYKNLQMQLQRYFNKMGTTNLLIQEYIEGAECEVFVIRLDKSFYSFDPIILKINNSPIITSEISNEYDYTFAPLVNEFSQNLCDSIRITTQKAAQFLNIKNYARFDYRIDKDGNYFLIDIAGSPYLTRHSSIEYLFTHCLNLKYSDIFLLIATLTISNYLYDVNCKSDNGNPLDT